MMLWFGAGVYQDALGDIFAFDSEFTAKADIA